MGTESTGDDDILIACYEYLRKRIAMKMPGEEKMAASDGYYFRSRCGAMFAIDPKFLPAIQASIVAIRKELQVRKDAGSYLAYMSVPFSSVGGGNRPTNKYMSIAIAKQIIEDFGDKIWVLNPALYDLPVGAKGGEYMAVWSEVLSGETQTPFDLVYFVGPRDVWRFFGADAGPRINAVKKWLLDAAAHEPAAENNYKTIVADKDLTMQFVRYYALRGSVIYSKGAHDEWNIVSALNSEREIGDAIAIYFDGLPVEPGDYLSSLQTGNELGVLRRVPIVYGSL